MPETFKEFVRDIISFNQGYKEQLALKFFGKCLRELTEQEQLDLEDIIRENNN